MDTGQRTDEIDAQLHAPLIQQEEKEQIPGKESEKEKENEEAKESIISVRTTIAKTANLSIKETANLLWHQSWPFVLSRLFTMANNYATVLILSHDEKHDNYLASSGLVTTGQLFTASTAVGALFSTAICSGGRKGASKSHEIGGIVQSSLVFGGLLSIGIIILNMFSAKIFKALGQETDLSDTAEEYFIASSWGIPAYLFLNSLQQFLIAAGKPKAILASTAQNLAILGGTGYALVNGIESIGLPNYGMAGMGHAFSLSNWITFFSLAVYCLREEFNEFRLKDLVSVSRIKQNLAELCSFGLPISLQVAAELFVVFMFALWAGWEGDMVLATNQVADPYLTMVVVSSFGLAQTIGTLTRQQVGAGNFHNSQLIGKVALGMGFVASAVMCLIFIFASEPLIRLVDSGDDIDLNLGKALFLRNGVGLVGDIWRNLALGWGRGYGPFTIKLPTLLNIIFMAGVSLGLGYVLRSVEDQGLKGAYTARAIAMYLAAVATTLPIAYTAKKRITEIEIPQQPPQTLQGENVEKPISSQWNSSSFVTSWSFRPKQKSNSEASTKNSGSSNFDNLKNDEDSTNQGCWARLSRRMFG